MEGKITSLTFQKHNPDRVNVYLDGQFAFGLAAIEAARLRVGQFLSAPEVAELQGRDAEEQAYEKALDLLSYRPRSTTELARRLRQAEFPPPATEAALDRLKRVGLVDDRAFAKWWVENREKFRPRGRRMLRWELRQKGVSDHIIDEVLAPLDERSSASKLAQKRAPRLRDLDKETFRRRLRGYLARRGFPYSIVRDVVQEAWEELQVSAP
ncbi:MAG: RecX family transcriptional regulator [Chloroflexota bacterium]|nr:RecX family transcriptional regulator [Chloroflexota bacterium]